MKKIFLNFVIIAGAFILMSFKNFKYKTITVEFENKPYSFLIPNSFCKLDSSFKNVFDFVKCYELKLQEEGELSFFSERIVIAFEENDKNVQNVSDKVFAKSQLNSFNALSMENKENYYFNKFYPNKNEIITKVINDNYIFNRISEDKNKNKFIVYESNLFLNKKYTTIDWVQYLTKNEKPLNEKRFAKFVEDNKEINKTNQLLYNFGRRQILISRPNFGDYTNYTDIETFNSGNFFHALFIDLPKTENDTNLQIFKVSLFNDSNTTLDGFELLKKDSGNFDKLELVKYKGVDFIKILRKGSLMFTCYINFSKNITGFLSFETSETKNETKYLKEIYKYRKQLIEENI